MFKVSRYFVLFSLISLHVLAQSKDEVVLTNTDVQIAVKNDEQLTVEQAVRMALKNAPQIDIAQQELALREAQLKRAKALYVLPKLELTALGGLVPDLPSGFGPQNNFPNFESDLSNLGPFIQSKISLLQPIYLFNKLKRLKKAAQSGVASADNGLLAQQNEIIEQVQTVYWTHIYLLKVKDFINELLERSTKAKDIVNKRLDQGSSEVTDVDLMRIKVFTNETLRRMADAQRGIDISLYTLKMLTGLPADKKVSLADDSLPRIKLKLESIDHYYKRAKVARPEIAQVTKAIDAQDYLTKAKKSDFFPSFFVAGQWNYAKAPGRAQVHNHYLSENFNRLNFGASLGLRQNLSFFNMNAEYKEEKAKLKLAQAKKNFALKAIELDVRDKYLQFKAKQESFKRSSLALKSARSWVLSSTLNFGAGLITAREMLESFVGYAGVKATFLEQALESNKSLFRLRRSVGEDIVKN